MRTATIAALSATFLAFAGGSAFAQGAMSSSSSSKMAPSEMKTMHECQAMSHSKMMQNKNCMALMKKYPDQMKGTAGGGSMENGNGGAMGTGNSSTGNGNGGAMQNGGSGNGGAMENGNGCSIGGSNGSMGSSGGSENGGAGNSGGTMSNQGSGGSGQ